MASVARLITRVGVSGVCSLWATVIVAIIDKGVETQQKCVPTFLYSDLLDHGHYVFEGLVL
jgi:hypothetical protein